MGGFMNKKKLFQLAKGFRGRSKNCYRLAYRRVEKGLQHAYVGRKLKKREFRSVWIQRINAGARQFGVTYGRLINGLNLTGVQLNRKMLSQLAIYEPFSFQSIVTAVKEEADLPSTNYPTYGLLQTTVTNDQRPVARKPLPYWNQLPIRSNLGWTGADKQ